MDKYMNDLTRPAPCPDLLAGTIRHDWSEDEIKALFRLPFNDLVFAAQTIHRRHFTPNQVQKSTLLSIKTGGCQEDCAYCNQSVHFDTGLTASKLMAADHVIVQAKRARDSGATRYCMGAAWREPKERDMDSLCRMVSGVKQLGLETCMTLGMLTASQAQRLKAAGLDYYNHNIDTSEAYYHKIISTRTFQDRLATLAHVRNAGLNVCCGGIVGMGEGQDDRADMLRTLANLPEHPQSVPINMLMRVEGTPLGDAEPIDSIDFIKTIAVARVIMPKSMVRLSAGRDMMTDEFQALCFLAGANSIFIGETLLTTKNPEPDKDEALFEKLGLEPMPLDN